MIKLLLGSFLAVSGAILVALCVAIAIFITVLICLGLALVLGPLKSKIEMEFTPSKFSNYGTN